MGVELADCPQYSRTSDSPIHGHVFEFADDVGGFSTDPDPTVYVAYDGILSLYHAKIDNTHGTLRAPDDERLLPPTGWTGVLVFTADDGAAYTAHASIEITSRSGRDAGFTVMEWLPSGMRNYLPPLAEVTNVQLSYSPGTLSEIAPDLTFTVECIDREP